MTFDKRLPKFDPSKCTGEWVDQTLQVMMPDPSQVPQGEKTATELAKYCQQLDKSLKDSVVYQKCLFASGMRIAASDDPQEVHQVLATLMAAVTMFGIQMAESQAEVRELEHMTKGADGN